MGVTAKEVNELRKTTGAGMMDCKNALVEANGEFETAIDILRKKGQKISAKRADKDASEGSVFVVTNSDSTEGFLIALNCETDFVAKTDGIVELGNNLINAISSASVDSTEEIGGLTLSDGRTATDHITDLMGKIGEKVEITSYVKVTGEAVVPYIHANAKLGVLVSLKGATGDNVIEAGKDVAMQIAAMNPVAVSEDEVPADVIEREKAIGREKAIQEGKPEKIIDKIAEGTVKKYLKEATLLNQLFVKDSSKSIAQFLQSVDSSLTVESFKRINI